MISKINSQNENRYKEVEAEELGSYIGSNVNIHGSIYKIRRMSGFAFVLLRTKRMVIQCVYSPDKADFPIEDLKENTNVTFKAAVEAEERAKMGYELHLLSVRVLSVPYEEAPVVINAKEINASLETILDYRPITLRNEKERAVFKIQEGICRGIRQYLEENKFTEIHSPKIVFAGVEGGANVFALNYFGKEAYLAQSPQIYKQMMVGVYERVFEIAPVYRAEKHDTSRHLNEYTSVDFEMGFIESFTEIMQMEVGMIRNTFAYLNQHYEKELALLQISIPEVNEIPAIPFYEAKDLVSKTYKREIKDYEDFEPEEEKLLGEIIRRETGSDFVFVTHYPSSKRPFYAMEDAGNRKVTLSFDLLFRGIEVTTGGQRIHDYQMQVEKMKERGMNPEVFESYLMMHKYGMPPHGGLGLGLERFTMSLLGKSNVRYASLFPRDISRVTP
ncbi:MAG TPA: aspartate--tRNA(Asn) ligase [Lachnospiraceae bacterium]|nr:aspartate--tRNA(Asn) ligase [Lachnospiraceae bacterium]